MKHFLSLIIFVLLSTGCINNKGSDIRRLALENLWEDPISLSLQTYCLYNYDIPANIHDITSFLEVYRDGVCDEIMYPGEKIDSVITLLEKLVLQQFDSHTLIISETIWSTGTDKSDYI